MNEKELVSEFRNQVMSHFYRLTCNIYADDNYDEARFGMADDDLIGKYDITSHINYLYFFLKNTSGFFKTYQMLSDKESKCLFIDLILYRLLGFPHVKLVTNTEEHWEVRKKAESLPSTQSQFNFNFLGEKIRHYELEYLKHNLLFDGIPGNIAWSFYDIPIYDYRNNKVTVMVESGDIVYDCGACTGDTTLKFAIQAGKKGKVEAFDFMPNHIDIIKHNIQQNPNIAERINIQPYAVGEKTQYLNTTLRDEGSFIQPAASLAFGNLSNEANIPMVSLDDWHMQRKIKAPHYIKMDIEGYEQPALLGAKRIIQQYKPKLAISLYHKIDDFITLPALIKSMVPEYNLYIGHYTVHHEETVLYAKII